MCSKTLYGCIYVSDRDSMALYYTLKLTPSLANRNIIKILVLNAGDTTIDTGGTKCKWLPRPHQKYP